MMLDSLLQTCFVQTAVRNKWLLLISVQVCLRFYNLQFYNLNRVGSLQSPKDIRLAVVKFIHGKIIVYSMLIHKAASRVHD